MFLEYEGKINLFYTMKRLFIGVPIYSQTAVQVTEIWQADQSLNLNRLVWTKPSNWHMTLVFLGACPEAVVSQLISIMDEAFKLVPAYTSLLTGVGVFPEKGRPNVWWLGLDNIQPLLPGYIQLVSLLRRNDFVFDSKPLKPHLTVARIKYLANRDYLESMLEEYRPYNFGMININRVNLFESVSTPQGVRYDALYEKELLRK